MRAYFRPGERPSDAGQSLPSGTGPEEESKTPISRGNRAFPETPRTLPFWSPLDLQDLVLERSPPPQWFLRRVSRSGRSESAAASPRTTVTTRPAFRFSTATRAVCFPGGDPGRFDGRTGALRLGAVAPFAVRRSVERRSGKESHALQGIRSMLVLQPGGGSRDVRSYGPGSRRGTGKSASDRGAAKRRMSEHVHRLGSRVMRVRADVEEDVGPRRSPPLSMPRTRADPVDEFVERGFGQFGEVIRPAAHRVASRPCRVPSNPANPPVPRCDPGNSPGRSRG